MIEVLVKKVTWGILENVVVSVIEHVKLVSKLFHKDLVTKLHVFKANKASGINFPHRFII